MLGKYRFSRDSSDSMYFSKVSEDSESITTLDAKKDSGILGQFGNVIAAFSMYSPTPDIYVGVGSDILNAK